jgi:hypothetical protein
VGFSRIFFRRDSSEEVNVQGQPDRRDDQAGSGRGAGGFALPGGRDQRRRVLHLAMQVRGMDVSMLARVRELEEENRCLKKMYDESQMDSTILKDALAKK